VGFSGFLRYKDYLCKTEAVPYVNKDKLAVVAPARNPAAKNDLFLAIPGFKLCAGVRS
jgi:hypothetical protein